MMTRKRLTQIVLLIAGISLLIAACSIEITQTSTVPTRNPPTSTETRTPTATPLPPTETPIPTATEVGTTAEPTATEEPTPTALPFDFPLLSDESLDYQIQTGWEEMGLTGKLLFLSLTETGQAVVVFDFERGTLAPIFLAPENSWVLAASMMPDHSNILLAYAPPPEPGETQFGYSDLYILPPNGADPVALLTRTEDLEAYFSSFYSPDGSTAYFSWFFTDDSVGYGFRYHVRALDLATGESEVVIEDGFWQTISRDGRLLAYVTFDPDANPEDPAELRVLDLGTGETRTVLDVEQFPTVDAPFFSPDNRYLYFSAVGEAQDSLSWLDRLLGVTIASAHMVPSDWYRVSLETFEVERVTEVYDQGMFGVFSPDGTHIAYISATGLWVMKPDGSELVQVIESSNFYGNLEWIP